MLQYRFDDIVERFFIARRAARYSENTLLDYQNTYKKFKKFLGNPIFKNIKSEQVAQFMASDLVSGVSKKTALNYHIGLSSLWNWAVENSFVENNFVRLVKPPKPEQREIIPYTRREVVKLLEASKSGINYIRDEAIILILLDTGIRASEICKLEVKDFNQIERRLLIRGKGDKERQVKISIRTLDALNGYLFERGIRNLRNNRRIPIFVTIFDSSFTRNTIRQLMERLEFRSGVNHVYAHRFRHTFAINFLRNGGNIYSLQKILGHTTLDMVKRYLRIAQIDIDYDHAKASPVKNWNL